MRLMRPPLTRSNILTQLTQLKKKNAFIWIGHEVMTGSEAEKRWGEDWEITSGQTCNLCPLGQCRTVCEKDTIWVAGDCRRINIVEDSGLIEVIRIASGEILTIYRPGAPLCLKKIQLNYSF